jgi:hypothetical protein
MPKCDSIVDVLVALESFPESLLQAAFGLLWEVMHKYERDRSFDEGFERKSQVTSKKSLHSDE